MKRILIVLGSIVLVVGAAGLLFLRSLGMFAESPVYTTERGAIDGYDVVAYFASGIATPGDAAHAVEWNGSRWLFSSAANREKFRLAPERFAPQYGGYCAYGMASGYTAFTDPEVFSVVDGRLYLNFDAGVQADWQADRDAMIERADVNWPASRPARKGSS